MHEAEKITQVRVGVGPKRLIFDEGARRSILDAVKEEQNKIGGNYTDFYKIRDLTQRQFREVIAAIDAIAHRGWESPFINHLMGNVLLPIVEQCNEPDGLEELDRDFLNEAKSEFRNTAEPPNGDADEPTDEREMAETTRKEYTALSMAGEPPPHPGAVIEKELVEASELEAAEIAEMAGIHRNSFYDLLGGWRGLNYDHARSLSKVFEDCQKQFPDKISKTYSHIELLVMQIKYDDYLMDKFGYTKKSEIKYRRATRDEAQLVR